MPCIEDASGDPRFSDVLESALLASLRPAAPQGVNSRVQLARRSDEGTLVAGLDGSTSYGWLRIELLWVTPELRRSGVGRKLMDRAFDLARDRGCHACWLETSNRESQAFYRRLGFDEFGMLKNQTDQSPADHARWFFKRDLA